MRRIVGVTVPVLVRVEDLPLWFLAAALTLLDAILTHSWLALGIARERNPLLVALIDVTGAGHAMTFRAVVGVVLVIALGVLGRRHVSARMGLTAVSVVLAGVACWHVAGGTAAALA